MCGHFVISVVIHPLVYVYYRKKLLNLQGEQVREINLQADTDQKEGINLLMMGQKKVL